MLAFVVLSARRRLPVRSSIKEPAMRKYIDCRDFPSQTRCTIAISSDSEKELIDAAVLHAVTVHGYIDTPEFRAQMKAAVHEGTAEPA
jgi:hypothetical protein